MECHCIRAVDVPYTTRLYSSYLQDFRSVAGFYAHPPTLESIKRVAADVHPDLALRRDVAEINHCFSPSREGVEKSDLPSSHEDGRRAGEVPLGDAVRAAVERATAKLEGPAAGEIRTALTNSYVPSETFGSAFGKLLARLFAGKGLILLDALSPELHRLAEPIYRAALERHSELNQALLARAKDLERASYHVQVKVVEESTPLFISLDGKRLPVRARNADFIVGRRSFSLSDLTDLLARS